jgi:hypothetical protein
VTSSQRPAANTQYRIPGALRAFISAVFYENFIREAANALLIQNNFPSVVTINDELI